MEGLSLVVGLGLAIGTGLISHTVLSVLFDLLRKVIRFLGRGRLSRLAPEVLKGKEKEKLPGIKDIPWGSLYAAAALMGLFFFLVLGPYLPTLRPLFLAFPFLVWLARWYLYRRQKRFLNGQVRQFLLDVRLHMSLQGSLLLGLESINQTSLKNTPVHSSLERRLKGASAQSGQEILKQLADDLDSPHLQRVVQKIEAARLCGGLTDIDQAISSVINILNEEISYQTEEEMQRLPLRITLLAMPLLLGPIVILLFYPLVDRILKTISGVAINSGF